jgi:outer membrane protein OmpA-like peptidoglycan-associated protein
LKHPEPDFDLELHIDQLELPLISPYLDQMLGLHVNKGTLFVTANGVAQNSALNGELGIAVDDLEVTPVTPEDGKAFKEEFRVSVEFATGVLKDKEGRIELRLPVSGTVAEPKIRYGEVVKKALRGAVRTVFRNKFRKDEGDDIFASVVFAPGSAELDDKAKDVVDQYVAMLKEQKELSIYVCGQATAQDYTTIVSTEKSSSEKRSAAVASASAEAPVAPDREHEKELVALAMERTEVVRGYFIEENGIDTDRVAQCRVSTNAQDTKPPRVELSL